MKGNDAARWFIYQNPELASGYIDENTKINKLIYFSNLMYRCVKGENLIEDEFVAFPNGPVVFSVYRDYRYHGLSQMPQQIVPLEGDALKVLQIVNFVYGGSTTQELVQESHGHSLWQRVQEFIPNNPKIEFDAIEPELVAYNQQLYDTYASLDFSNIRKEKINNNIYYYYQDSFEMTDDVIEQLSSFGKFDEPKFLENIDGELVVS